MYKIIGSKCCGKTSQLIQLAKENNAIVACSNPLAMEVKAHSYEIVGVSFTSYEDVFNHPDEKIMIDELGDYVNYLLSGKLIGYTLSEED